jgi:6-phosphogluconolactonase (cycloisomerase 2 family)
MKCSPTTLENERPVRNRERLNKREKFFMNAHCTVTDNRRETMNSKRTLTGIVTLFVLAALAACGGGGGGGGAAATPPPNNPPPNNVPRFAYVANYDDDTVSIYTVNATTGQLRHNGYVATGANPISVAVDPAGKFAYVANNGTNSVSAYAINASTGALTRIDCGGGAGCNVEDFTAGASPWSVTVDPTGKFAYVANLSSASISAYSINAGTGVLTGISCGGGLGCSGDLFTAGAGPRSVTVDPSGKFLYVANSFNVAGGNSVSAYTINATTGALTSVGPATVAGTNPYAVTVDPSGKFVYVANRGSSNISAYTLNASSGALTEYAGGTFAVGANPQSVTVDPSGKFVYTTNFNSNSISTYDINATTGALGDGRVTAAITNPFGVIVDPSGKFVYVANQGSDNISAYRIDAGTGDLTALSTSTVAGRNGNLAMAMTRGTAAVRYTPKFAYVANGLGNSVSAYTIHSGSGALTSVGVAAETGTTPQAVAVDPRGKFAYVPNDGGGVSAYTINAISGVLTRIDADPAMDGIQTFPAGTNPRSIAIDPTGRYAYVANWGSNTLSAFTIDSVDGRLNNLFTVDVGPGTNPRSITIAPSGRFAYVANQDASVSAYTIGTDGVLTPIDADPATQGIQNFPAGIQPFSVTIDSSGQYAYVANSFNGTGGNSVSAYTISATTGVLTPIDADPGTDGIQNFPAGTNPRSVTVDPAGRFALVANFGSNSVSAHPIHAVIGGFTNAVAFTTGINPFSVTVDQSGTFAYVANFGDDTVSAYRIDNTTGLIGLGLAVGSGDGPVSITTTGTIE